MGDAFPLKVHAQIDTVQRYQRMEDIGPGLADVSDAAAAITRPSSDTSLNGKSTGAFGVSFIGFASLELD